MWQSCELTNFIVPIFQLSQLTNNYVLLLFILVMAMDIHLSISKSESKNSIFSEKNGTLSFALDIIVTYYYERSSSPEIWQWQSVDIATTPNNYCYLSPGLAYVAPEKLLQISSGVWEQEISGDKNYNLILSILHFEKNSFIGRSIFFLP